MDPLSVAASVAGLVSLTLEVSCTIGSYCKSVKNARNDVLEIAQELASMRDVLRQLDELLRSHQLKTEIFDQSSVLPHALTVCVGNIESISSKMQNLNLDGVARVWEKLKWPFSEREMQKTLATLQRCAATFQFALSVEGCILLSRSSEDATKSLALQQETARRVLELTQGVGTMAESAKEAFKVSNQVSEILRLVSDYDKPLHAMQALSHSVDAIAARSQENKETEILSWLSSHKHSLTHHNTRARRVAGTGLWLLEHEVFRAWIGQSHPILWCSGAPGAGKSVLTSLVIDHILEKEMSSNEALAYFYFDYRDQHVQTPAFFLANLLRQLAARRRPLPESVLNFYNCFKDEQPQNLISELRNVFRLTCEVYERCYIVIDALDECKHQSHRKEIVQAMKSLPTAKTRVFVTSRPHTHDLKQYFEDGLKIDIEASETDVKQYCSRMIEENLNAKDLMSDALRQQVTDTISSKANGMFLLPVLQLQRILEAMTKSEIKASLSNLSANLGQAFENTIQRIGNEPTNRRQVALRALMWVSHARRPLRVDELCHALATKLGDKELDQDNLLPPRSIIESCSGLIVLDDEGSTFRLVHYTLQDYLQSRRPQTYLQEETFITQSLITYLCFDQTTDATTVNEKVEDKINKTDQGLIEKSSFLEYAATNWGHHAKLSQSSEINKLALGFLTDTPRLTRATQSLTRSLAHGCGHVRDREPWISRYRHKRTGLHVVAAYGLVDLLGLLLDFGLEVDARDGYENTALHDAAIYGHSGAVNLLLERGAEVNVQNLDYNSPLYLAVSFSHEELLPALLKQGAKLDGRCKDSWSPLHKAADNGHLAIAQTLLNHGASVIAQTPRGLIPLHRAAGRGHVQMVLLLLKYGSPVDMETWDGWTPLHGASSSGQDEVVKILLDHNANINEQSRDKRMALHRACRGGHYDVVSRLLRGNADLWIKDCNGSLPLHRAARGGHERVIKLLLQQDSVSQLKQLLAVDIHGRKPEKEASNSGHWRVATLLRQEEFLHKGMGAEERSDLELAIEKGNLSQVTELLSNGADVNKTISDSSTPLHQALLVSNEPIARLLFENNADVTTATSDGWQPLHCAASKGMSGMVNLCLDRKADIAARTLDGQTALHKSCKNGDLETVRLLLDSGADIEAQDDWCWRPIHTAAAAGFQDVVEFLIARNADLKARDRDSRTVQACAAVAGKHALVEYLRQARHEPIDSWHWNPIDGEMSLTMGGTAISASSTRKLKSPETTTATREDA